VASSLSTRLVRVYRESGLPLPKFSDDDVLDYMVKEAIIIKNSHDEKKEREKAENDREREEFKKDFSNIEETLAKQRMQ
jgi:hypothetical protein